MHNTEELEDILMSPLENDSNQNTIAHLAAESGQASVFKVSVCLYRPQIFSNPIPPDVI